MNLLNALIEYVLAFEENGSENNVSELQRFRLALKLSDYSDIGYLYSTAVFHKKFELSNIILGFTEYNLNNQFIKTEIFWFAENGRFDCISKLLDDGYFPQIEVISEIKAFFWEHKYHQHSDDIYQRLNHLKSLRLIEKIRNKIRNRK